MTKRRKILAVFASMAILTSVLSTTAFAATPENSIIEPQNSVHSNYTIETNSEIDGATKLFDCDPGKRIEYTGVNMTSKLSSARGRVSLWKKPGIGGIEMPLEQVFTVKSNNRAYWDRCDTARYLVHLKAFNNQLNNGSYTEIKTVGTLRNFNYSK